jgi:toxin ParE1/3/4
MNLIWTKRAIDDLIAIADTINAINPRAAIGVRNKIRQSAERLPEFPLSGRAGRVAGTRELVVSGLPYIIPYRVRDGRIEILAIFHAARQWPDAL